MKAVLFFDGGCEPRNPGGVATWGYVLEFEEGPSIAGHGLAAKPYSPEATNNVAEWHGLLAGLARAKGARVTNLDVRGDSQLVIRQLRGEWAVRAPHLAPLHAQAVLFLHGFPQWRATWIPREQNEGADREARRAYDEHVSRRPLP